MAIKRARFLGLALALTLSAAPSGAQAQVQKLLLVSVAVAPAGAEAIVIYNPNAQAVALERYFLADYNDYYLVTTGGVPAATSDFVAKFPTGAMIGPGETRIVSVQGEASFGAVFPGIASDYEIVGSSAFVPDMESPNVGSIGSARALTDAGEPIILFHWDGQSQLVTDVDYVYYNTGAVANLGVNKTGVIVGQAAYKPDTADDVGRHAGVTVATTTNTSRTDFAETGQTATGGNGVGGSDETSENNSSNWAGSAVPFFFVSIFRDGFEG